MSFESLHLLFGFSKFYSQQLLLNKLYLFEQNRKYFEHYRPQCRWNNYYITIPIRYFVFNIKRMSISNLILWKTNKLNQRFPQTLTKFATIDKTFKVILFSSYLGRTHWIWESHFFGETRTFIRIVKSHHHDHSFKTFFN